MSSAKDIEDALRRASCTASETVRRRLWKDIAERRQPRPGPTPDDPRAAGSRTIHRSSVPRLAAAAAVIAAVSFLLGRSSLGPPPFGPVAEPVAADAGDTVVVSKDLVACVNAARLFKKFGMDDRMNRALDCASRLLPPEVIAADSAAANVLVAGDEASESQAAPADRNHTPGQRRSAPSGRRMLAESLGGYYHASKLD